MVFIVDKSDVTFVNNDSLARGDLVDQLLSHRGEVMHTASIRHLCMNAVACPQVDNNLMVSTSTVHLFGIVFGISSLVGISRLVYCCDSTVKAPNESLVKVVWSYHFEA